MTLTIDLVPHMDAGDRKQWQQNQDERPLSDLGHAQARALANAFVRKPIDALYSSPALRCRQTLEPFAKKRGLDIVVLPELRETDGFAGPQEWISGQYGAAYAAGRALVAVEQIRTAHDEGHVIVCSHGDIIPSLVACLAGAHELESVPRIERRGQWYRVRFTKRGIALELAEAAAFPL